MAAALVLYLVVVSLVMSPRRMMWDDEFVAWHLLADPTWAHAAHNWLRGADGGGPLFYILDRLVYEAFGADPTRVRFAAVICTAAAMLLWGRMLARYVPLAAAAIAVGLCWMSSSGFLFHLYEVRFYGQLVLGVAMAAAAMLWIERRQPPLAACFVISWFTGAFLITTHMLGIIYSGLMMLMWFFSDQPMRRRVTAVLGSFTGWATLLLYLRTIRSDASILTWVRMPNVSGVIRFLFHTPVMFLPALRFSVAVNAVLLGFAAVGASVVVRGARFGLRERAVPATERGRSLFLAIGAVLAITPLVFYVVSHLYQPIFAERYLLPYLLGLSALVALGMARITAGWSRQQAAAGTAVAALLLVALQIADLRVAATYEPFTNLQPLLQIPAGNLPVVLDQQPLLDQAHFYGGATGARYWCMSPPWMKPAGSPPEALSWGYEPFMPAAADFLAATPHFYLIKTRMLREQHLDAVLTDPAWTSRQVGTVMVDGEPEPMYELERRAPVH